MTKMTKGVMTIKTSTTDIKSKVNKITTQKWRDANQQITMELAEMGEKQGEVDDIYENIMVYDRYDDDF